MPRRSLFLLFVLIALLAGNACVERSKVPKDAGSTTPPPTPTTGSTAPAAEAPPPKTCPPSKPDAACTKEYKPVVCEGCEYANPCLAHAAGFRSCMLKVTDDTKKPCPTPKPDVVCTMEYAPVKCDGCTYPNACTAGAAGFTKEQCVPVPGEQ